MTDPRPLPRWGVVSTIKASAQEVLTFAAYHLAQGAHRVCIYLDAPCPEALPHLKAHPKVRVIDCDDGYWRRQPVKRPKKHQVRQTHNANRAYQKQCKDLDWLAHIDVDEFIWSAAPLSQALAELPPEALCARLRPIEVMADQSDVFRAAAPRGSELPAVLRDLYPTYGAYSHRGLLSNAAGKLFLRTGLDEVTFRIHNAFVMGLKNPCQLELDAVDLCHFHGRSWADWFAHFSYRHANGAYRQELGARSQAPTPLNMHAVLADVMEREGEVGLRGFYDEFCADSPEKRAKLEQHGLLRLRPLHLEDHLRTHFPQFG
ncbi:glycosyltransferase family 2 protein [Epibacterium sp. SM1979]|uniref:Glycosyltransferase family 2 protein n=1 Tax=Tritonibacter litoralis TaxID=2662264 RepID=A0A843YD04_9RHOB|nr:glycosyltransferase family 2 protein [Tritonibacter litoralis]MQQ07545.1 glycosyltransferase family 2 protein [Tritonibacter litoralis]